MPRNCTNLKLGDVEQANGTGFAQSGRPGQSPHHSRLIYFATALLVVVIPAGCTTRTMTQPGEAFDAGSLYEADDHAYSHTFEVRNTTDRVVEVQGETHSCACTKVDFTPTTLKPGETTRLKLVVALPYSYAKQTLTSVVKTNDPKFPEWSYSLSYEFFPRARMLSDVVDLGRFALSGGVLDITNPPQLVVVEAFTATSSREMPAPGPIVVPEGLTAAIDPSPEIIDLVGGMRRLRWTIRVAADPRSAGAGSYSGILRVRLAGLREVTTRVAWSVDTAVTCSPAQIHFGVVGRERKSRRVILRSRDSKPFRLSLPPSKEAEFAPAVVEIPTKGSAANGASSTHTIEITISGPFDHLRQTLSGSIVLDTDMIATPKLLIPWSAFIRSDVQAELPTNLPFQQDAPR